eukprot:Rhum_TRINITY_DN7760_c0_g1::Rhum_TRINITY_DN7760_c0_g1_i1::g.24583::m.24583
MQRCDRLWKDLQVVLRQAQILQRRHLHEHVCVDGFEAARRKHKPCQACESRRRRQCKLPKPRFSHGKSGEGVVLESRGYGQTRVRNVAQVRQSYRHVDRVLRLDPREEIVDHIAQDAAAHRRVAPAPPLRQRPVLRQRHVASEQSEEPPERLNVAQHRRWIAVDVLDGLLRVRRRLLRVGSDTRRLPGRGARTSPQKGAQGGHARSRDVGPAFRRARAPLPPHPLGAAALVVLQRRFLARLLPAQQLHAACDAFGQLYNLGVRRQVKVEQDPRTRLTDEILDCLHAQHGWRRSAAPHIFVGVVLRRVPQKPGRDGELPVGHRVARRLRRLAAKCTFFGLRVDCCQAVAPRLHGKPAAMSLISAAGIYPCGRRHGGTDSDTTSRVSAGSLTPQLPRHLTGISGGFDQRSCLLRVEHTPTTKVRVSATGFKGG